MSCYGTTGWPQDYPTSPYAQPYWTGAARANGGAAPDDSGMDPTTAALVEKIMGEATAIVGIIAGVPQAEARAKIATHEAARFTQMREQLQGGKSTTGGTIFGLPTWGVLAAGGLVAYLIIRRRR